MTIPLPISPIPKYIADALFFHTFQGHRLHVRLAWILKSVPGIVQIGSPTREPE